MNSSPQELAKIRKLLDVDNIYNYLDVTPKISFKNLQELSLEKMSDYSVNSSMADGYYSNQWFNHFRHFRALYDLVSDELRKNIYDSLLKTKEVNGKTIYIPPNKDEFEKKVEEEQIRRGIENDELEAANKVANINPDRTQVKTTSGEKDVDTPGQEPDSTKVTAFRPSKVWDPDTGKWIKIPLTHTPDSWQQFKDAPLPTNRDKISVTSKDLSKNYVGIPKSQEQEVLAQRAKELEDFRKKQAEADRLEAARLEAERRMQQAEPEKTKSSFASTQDDFDIKTQLIKLQAEKIEAQRLEAERREAQRLEAERQQQEKSKKTWTGIAGDLSKFAEYYASQEAGKQKTYERELERLRQEQEIRRKQKEQEKQQQQNKS